MLRLNHCCGLDRIWYREQTKNEIWSLSQCVQIRMSSAYENQTISMTLAILFHSWDTHNLGMNKSNNILLFSFVQLIIVSIKWFIQKWFFVTIIAIVTASTAISSETDYTCCKHVHWSLTCCALCLYPSLMADLTDIQTEACIKCTLCLTNGDNCFECTRGDNGCPMEAYNKIEEVFFELKEE